MFKIWKILRTVIKFPFLIIKLIIKTILKIINPILIRYIYILSKSISLSKIDGRSYNNKNQLYGNMFDNYYRIYMPFNNLPCVLNEVPIGFKMSYGADVGKYFFADRGTRNEKALREVAFFAHGEFEFWCETNCTGKWGRIEEYAAYSYFFERAEDAALFKLFFIDYIKEQ